MYKKNFSVGPQKNDIDHSIITEAHKKMGILQ